jgi:exodeoxyribonuclease-1
MSYYNKNKAKASLTFLVKDYETFSLNTKESAVSQFAAIRTDENLNEIEEPMNIYCSLSKDVLPSPTAALITGVTPQMIEAYKKDRSQEVHNENWFINKISYQLSRASTCTLGYNNLSFDDEVTRNLLYRNFRDPYEREWRNGNSRFDVYPLVIATNVLRPELLKFPDAIDSKTGEVSINKRTNKPNPSFRLEELSTANGIIHENAHDALSDVRATIGIIKLIKDKDPEFFNSMFDKRIKNNVKKWLSEREDKPFIYMSPFFGKEDNSLGVMYKIADHPTNSNAIIAYNLRKNPDNLINLGTENLESVLFASKEELLEQNLERIGLQIIKVNQCPMLADLVDIKDRALDLGLNGAELRENKKKIESNLNQIKEKVTIAYNREFEEETNPDRMIYSGGFFDKAEKEEMSRILKAVKNKELKEFEFLNPMSNSRLPEMLLRFKGRNFKDQMGVVDFEKWKNYCQNKINKADCGKDNYNLEKYYNEIEELLKVNSNNPKSTDILNALKNYGKSIEKEFDLSKKNQKKISK